MAHFIVDMVRRVSIMLVFVVAFVLTPRWSAADARYMLHSRDGEILSNVMSKRALVADHISQPDSCAPIDDDLQDRLWRMLRRHPIVTVHNDHTMTLQLWPGQPALPPNDSHVSPSGAIIGFWDSSTPGIFIAIAVQDGRVNGRGDQLPPRFDVSISTSSGCFEKWVGSGWDRL